MNSQDVQQRLVEAETKLTRALQRLLALRRAALYGTYDPAEFDQALLSYRQAEVEAHEARDAWARWQGGEHEPAAAVEEEERSPEEVLGPPTPRMLFTKWLVDHGRLSDFIEDKAEVEDEVTLAKVA